MLNNFVPKTEALFRQKVPTKKNVSVKNMRTSYRIKAEKVVK
jgi:hypothetical protein